MSRNGTRAVLDAGLKAVPCANGLPLALDPQIEVVKLDSEHTHLRVAPESPLGVGDLVVLVPASLELTLNAHTSLLVLDQDGNCQAWEIDGRRS